MREDLERLPAAPFRAFRGCKVVEVSPLGETILVAGHGDIELRRLRDGGPLRSWGLAASVLDARFSPDGKWIAVGGTDARVNVYDASTGRHAGASAKMADYVDALLWLGKTPFLAALTQGEHIAVIDARTMRELASLKAPASYGSFAALPSGDALFVCGDTTIVAYEVASGRVVWTFNHPLSSRARLAVSPDGRVLAYANGKGIGFVDATKGHPGPVLRFRCPTGVTWPELNEKTSTGWVGKLFHRDDDDDDFEMSESFDPKPVFSPNGRLVALQDPVGNLNFVDVASASIHPLPRAPGRAWIESIAWLTDGNHVLLGSSDNSIAVWSVHPLTAVMHAQALEAQG